MIKKKMVYITPNMNRFPGVKSKIKNQVSYFDKFDFLSAKVFFDKEKTLFDKILQRMPFISRQLFNIKSSKLLKYDIIYIRKPECFDLNFLLFLKQLKRRNKCVLLELPTYPFKNESKLFFKTLPYSIKNIIYTPFLKKYVDRIITFSRDERIYGIPTIKTSNGADFEFFTKKNKDFNVDNIILGCSAKHEYWHGYDRLIRGLGEYYKSDLKNKKNIYIYIIGDGSSNIMNLYKNLALQYNIENRIKFLGDVDKKTLNNILDEVDVAIDSLGRHRSGVFYNSSLKGKEYLAKGLPIVSGVETELDCFSDYNFYYRVPADESSINVEKLMNFYTNKILSKESFEITNYIRDFGYQNFDFSTVITPIYNYIEEYFEKE